MTARNGDLCGHGLYMIRPLISCLEYLRKRCGLIDLAVVEGAKVPEKQLLWSGHLGVYGDCDLL
jgi:hypothetical protein